MLGGYAGKILFVNLSKGSISEELLPEQVCREFVGGYGLGIRVLYEKMKARVAPLGEENMLGIVTGVLTATSVPGSGRYGVVTKSPLTGAWSESNAGGTFGPELKTAGYDAIFFSGISPKPVYLLIRDGKAELRDASGLWGKDTYETEECIQNETGDNKLKVACIGPAGEAKSLLAGIVNERGRIAARGGAGAVMGSKNLKAIAVRGGTHKMGIAHRDRLKETQSRFLSVIKASDFAKGLTAAGTGGALSFLVSIGDSPVKNWRLTGTDSMPTAAKLDSANMDKYKKSAYACQACPIRCGAIIEQREGPFAIPGETHRPEYESISALGSLLMNDNLEAVIKANDICNRYGIDTISTGTAIAFAMECYENGLITKEDTDGMDLTWGNADAIVALTEKIAKREGFGAVLADGPTIAAERVGKGSEKYAVAVRGKGLPFHDPRMSPAGGTAFIADCQSRPPYEQSDYRHAGKRSAHRKRSGIAGAQNESLCGFRQEGPDLCHWICVSSTAGRCRHVRPVYGEYDAPGTGGIDLRCDRLGLRLGRSAKSGTQSFDLEAGIQCQGRHYSGSVRPAEEDQRGTAAGTRAALRQRSIIRR